MMNGELKLSIEGRIRADILTAAHSAGKNGAHIAPSLSVAEICLAVLGELDGEKDSFILSKGHGALGYYAAMHQLGMITDEQFASFEQDGGEFPGQPSRSVNNKVECSSGSLGMGLSYGLGVALGKRKTGGTVYVIVGDGELNEGSNWEAATLISRYGLDHVIVVVDNNGLQSDGKCTDIAGQDLAPLWAAYGWRVESCDGHSIVDLMDKLHSAHKGRPLAIIANTVKGKGVSFMEHNNAWHHAVLKDEDFKKAMREIGETYGLCEE